MNDSPPRFELTHRHGDEVTRFLAALATALLVVLILLRLPLYDRVDRVGWQLVARPPGVEDAFEQLHFTNPPLIPTVPGTRLIAGEGTGERQGGQEGIQNGRTPAAEEVSDRYSIERIQTMSTREAALNFAEEMPDIVGGIGAYYINIVYPEEAALKGIEGRLVLEFVVETSGIPTDIRVLKSLHPLCDSAAVKALRETRFIPGRQKGKLVRVHMRLPVRFQLVDRPVDPSDQQIILRRPYE